MYLLCNIDNYFGTETDFICFCHRYTCDTARREIVNPSNAELNPICHLLALGRDADHSPPSSAVVKKE